jgi:hypothetical protein
MKKIKNYILTILLLVSVAFNPSTSNAMSPQQNGFTITLPPAYPIQINIPRETLRSLLFLGTGIAGLAILTATINHITNTEKEPNHNTKPITSLITQIRRHSLGISSGILFLATGFWGLRSRINFYKLFGSKTVPSFPQPTLK